MIWLLYVNEHYSFFCEQLTNNCYPRSTNYFPGFLCNKFNLKFHVSTLNKKVYYTLNKLMIHSFFPVRKKVGSNTAVVSKLLCLNEYQIAERKAKHIENGEMIYHKNDFCTRYVQNSYKKTRILVVKQHYCKGSHLNRFE